MAEPIKVRVLKAEVIAGSDAATLETAMNAFFTSASQHNGELVSVLQVADFNVLVIYTGTAG